MLKYFFFLSFVFLLFGCNQNPDKRDLSALEKAEIIPVKKIYNIDISNALVEESKIKRNEFLANVFSKKGFSGLEIHNISQKANSVFDLRKIKAGNKYTFIRGKKDSALHYFIYETNAIEYLQINLLDSNYETRLFQKPVEIKTRKLAATIENSLYQTIENKEASLALAQKLASIYDWTIDFWGIHKGDYFKVIYEEKYVDGERIGIGEVYAVQFNHKGKDFYALLYDNGKPNQYYNEDGESMEKQYLRAPLKFSRISSRFSKRRFHPVQKRWKAHLGVDYAAPRGTPIRSIGAGKITTAAYGKYNGRYVKVKHNRHHSSQYLHMSRFAKGIKKGVYVSQGQVIGYVGSTGLATGPHLCFRFWNRGKQVNFLTVQSPPADPLKPEELIDFKQVTDSILPVLKNLSLGLDA